MSAKQETTPSLQKATDSGDPDLQWERLLPSEKAFAYKSKLESLKHQGKRLGQASAPMGQNFGEATSRQLVAQAVGESQDQIRRYIRLTELVPAMLAMVDEAEIAFRTAVELSYLKPEEQNALLEEMKRSGRTPMLSQAIRMKAASQRGELDEAALATILSEEKPQSEQFKMPREKLRQYFPSEASDDQIQKTILDALAFYQIHHK